MCLGKSLSCVETGRNGLKVETTIYIDDEDQIVLEDDQEMFCGHDAEGHELTVGSGAEDEGMVGEVECNVLGASLSRGQAGTVDTFVLDHEGSENCVDLSSDQGDMICELAATPFWG